MSTAKINTKKENAADANENTASKNTARKNNASQSTADELLLAVSHELRTPLNVIMGMCGIARLHGGEKKRVEECLQKISSAGDYMLGLIDGICDIARIDQSEKNGNTGEREFCIDDFAKELTDMIKPMAEPKGISLRICAADALNRNVRGDYSHVMQVMINLAANAVKYTQDGGHVKIDISERSNQNPLDVTYCFICSDNGMGMQADFLEKIYRPFVRADDARMSGISGMGLGMAVVREIVNMLDGKISISSRKGEGTTVEVSFDFRAGGGMKTVCGADEFAKRQTPGAGA